MPEEITNKDLHYIVLEIKDKVSEIKEKDLPEINGRAKTTNGSVADIKAWKEQVVGAAKMGGLCLTIIVIPLLTWAFITISKIDARIQKGIGEALSNKYDIEHE